MSTINLPYTIAQGDTTSNDKIEFNFREIENKVNTQPLQIASSADADAPNSSLYYSTDAGKLVWKDSGGSVHNLYQCYIYFQMANITLPTTLTNGTTADATEVMGNFNAIVTEYNSTVGGLSGTLLTSSNTVTVTNKTLTSPKINENVAVTSTATELNFLDGLTDALSSDNTKTLTNKRINPRVVGTTDDSTAVIDVDATDQYQLTAVANATTISTTGTPVNGQKLIIRLKDAGSAKGLTWDSVFRAVGVTLPTTTVVSKTLYVGSIYNSADSKWDVVAVVQEV